MREVFVEKLFKLQENGTTVRKEIVAGLTTFLTMAYILAINPGMLGSIGDGMSFGAVFTATAVASAFATLVMALMANLPVALAPGMGLNAFFTYTVVMGMGYSWRLALTAVFIQGLVFIVLAFFNNVREAIVKAIPANLKKAIAVGIGLFIALIGFANAHIVVGGETTIVGLGNLGQPAPLLAIIGLVIILVLYSLKVPGAILIGILMTTIIGIPMGVTMPYEGWDNWKPFSLPASPLFFQFEFHGIFTFKFLIIMFTFLFVNVFDSIGTLTGVTTQAGLADKDGNIPRTKQALLSNAIGTAAGAGLGTSTVTCYVESSAGVSSGGRTGLTSFTTAILFLAALFLSPLFGLIPGAAIAPALIMVGFLMMQPVTSINFHEPTEGIPAFLTIIIMPFAYSIADGIVYGIIAYVILKAVTHKFKEISVVTWALFVIFILRFFLQ
jgi:AGZA family xanthine/uracil permease-like MFS transporter